MNKINVCLTSVLLSVFILLNISQPSTGNESFNQIDSRVSFSYDLSMSCTADCLWNYTPMKGMGGVHRRICKGGCECEFIYIQPGSASGNGQCSLSNPGVE